MTTEYMRTSNSVKSTSYYAAQHKLASMDGREMKLSSTKSASSILQSHALATATYMCGNAQLTGRQGVIASTAADL